MIDGLMDGWITDLLPLQAAKRRVAWSEAVVALNGRGGGAWGWGGQEIGAANGESNGNRRRGSRHAFNNAEARRAG